MKGWKISSTSGREDEGMEEQQYVGTGGWRDGRAAVRRDGRMEGGKRFSVEQVYRDISITKLPSVDPLRALTAEKGGEEMKYFVRCVSFLEIYLFIILDAVQDLYKT